MIIHKHFLPYVFVLFYELQSMALSSARSFRAGAAEGPVAASAKVGGRPSAARQYLWKIIEGEGVAGNISKIQRDMYTVFRC